MRRLIGLLVFCVVALAGDPAAARASAAATGEAPEALTRVDVRAAAHPTFGRLVLEWPEPVQLTREGTPQAMILRFQRPFEAALDGVLARLSPYLEGIARSDDRREIRLALRPGVGAQLAQFEPHLVVVDLTPAAPRARPEVEVRTGEHDGFARVVFDWVADVGYRMRREGRELAIAFDRPAAIDAPALRGRLGTRVETLEVLRDERGVEVAMRLAPGIDARVFALERDRVVIDLLAAGAARQDAGSARLSPPAAGGGRDAAAGPLAAGSPALASAARHDTRAKAVARASPIAAGWLRSEPAAGPPAQAEYGGEPAARALPVLPAPQLDARPNDDGIELAAAWREPVPAAVFVRADHLWLVFGATLEDAADLLPFPLPQALQTQIGPGEAIRVDGASAWRLPLRRPLQVTVARAGTTWRVLLRRQAVLPAPVLRQRLDHPARLRLEVPDGRPIHLPDPAVGDQLVVWPLLQSGLGQPERRGMVGVEFLPTAQGVVWRSTSDGLQAAYQEGGLEFAMNGEAPPPGLAAAPALPATGGAAEEGPAPPAAAEPLPAAERPRLPEPSHPPVSRIDPATERPPTSVPDGAIPASAAREPDPREPADAGTAVAPPPLDLARWTLRGNETVPGRRALLMQRLVQAAGEEEPARRLDLARFFLAQAMAPEVLGVLRAAPAGHEAAARLAQQALEGAAEVLMGRPAQAAKRLGAAALDGDPEVALWRAAAAAGTGDWQGAGQSLALAGATLESYPPRLQAPLGLAAAQTALENGETPVAFALLDRLTQLDLPETERDRVIFLRGVAAARTGTPAEAERAWRSLADSRDPVTRIEATHAQIGLLLETGRIGPDEALHRLEAHRPAWRGHPGEAAMLDDLAGLHAGHGDAARAIRIWQEALRRHPDDGAAGNMARAMRAAFMDTLLGDTVASVRALALHHDFPELQPGGRDGERLQRRLAEHFARLELADPAAALLQRLLDHTAAGASSAEIGAALAELRLGEGEARAALAALEQSQTSEPLAKDLAGRRLIARARALERLGQPDAMQALLAGSHEPTTLRARAELLWQARDWAKLVPAIETILAPAASSGRALPAEEQDLLLKLAIAHTLLGDDRALAGLRSRYGPQVRGRPIEAAFLMATLGEVDRPEVPQAILAETGTHLEQLRRFLHGS